jgi:sugar O-acyltransferase (sialic acid O-acetyltransferase NeuD family)
MRRVVIVGAGGLGREAAWMIGRINAVTPHFELLGFCDDAEEKREGLCDTIPLLGTLDQVTARFGPVGFFCAIGNNHARREVTRYARSAGHEPVTLVDPSAVIAPDVVIGVGSYVGIRSVVSVGVRLGEGVLVNHQVCVGHDVRVGDFAQLCPGVCVSGGCELGEGALLGTLSGTIPLRRVGAWATVGAGTMAFRDVAEGQSVVRLIATT